VELVAQVVGRPYHPIGMPIDVQSGELCLLLLLLDAITTHTHKHIREKKQTTFSPPSRNQIKSFQFLSCIFHEQMFSTADGLNEY
jgi:hypothetical protein